ncbi:MAG: MerC domain-containing protein [Bacteroidota bacterium]
MQNFQLDGQKALNSNSDMFGAFASGLCLIHCLATPFLFVVQACSTSCCAAGPTWWSMIDYLFLGVSILAIYYSAKSTSLDWMPMALYASWVLLAILVFNESLQLLPLNHALIYLPALSLVGLHLYNRRYCQCEADRCCTTE